MKIALCLYGQPRNYVKGFKDINEKILLHYNADVFGHLWWSKDNIDNVYETAPWVKETYKIEEDLANQISSLYKFKRIKFEAPKTFIPTKTYKVSMQDRHDLFYNSFCCRYYSVKSSIELLEQYEKDENIMYDWVLLSRTDMFISKFPPLESLNNKNVYSISFHADKKYTFNDNFWIIGREYLYVFKNVLDNLDLVYERSKDLSEDEKEILKDDSTMMSHGGFLNGEEMITYMFLFEGILRKIIKHPDLHANILR